MINEKQLAPDPRIPDDKKKKRPPTTDRPYIRLPIPGNMPQNEPTEDEQSERGVLIIDPDGTEERL